MRRTAPSLRSRVSHQLLALWLLLLIVGTACVQEPPPSPPGAARSSPSVPPASPTTNGDPWSWGRPVAFTATDGVKLTGAEFGHGPVAVALAHMGRSGDDALDWLPTARMLVERGYKVLLFNRRGVCLAESDICSGGSDDLDEHWKDVAGGVQYLRSKGATRVVIGGASIGAMASLFAAMHPSVEVDGVIWFGGILDGSYRFTPRTVKNTDAPALLVSTIDDAYGAADSARTLGRWLGERADVVILPGFAHGTDIFAGSPRAARIRFRAALFRYLDELPGA